MGKVIWRLEDDVSTDIIYPGRFMATVLPSETPQYAFDDLTELHRRLTSGEVEPGSIIVGGQNFGSGSSREQAASTLKGHQLVIVARSFARIFLQNAINLGLPTITCPQIEAEMGDELRIDGDVLWNEAAGKSFKIITLAPARRQIVEAGGLIPYVRRRLQATSAQ